jgi:iron-sulfur cluster insertion protein
LRKRDLSAIASAILGKKSGFSQFFPVHQGTEPAHAAEAFDRASPDAYIGVDRPSQEVNDMAESISEIEERRIVVTESAARRIAVLRTEEQVENAFLRIAVSGGGCSGFQYGLSFDDQCNADDFVFERDGIAVVVDDVSLGLLNGAEVDFVEDLMGASFRINNPNAASSCGCGNSFSIG